MSEHILIRVYGDSLSMPRVSEGVAYADTYPELLAASWRESRSGTGVYLYNRSFSGATAPKIGETARSDSYYFGCPGGDVFILQCGIVDCAPRPVPDWFRTFISGTPERIRNRVVALLHKHRADILQKGFAWRDTSEESFLKNVTEIVSLAASEFKRVYVINIAPTIQKIESHSPGLSKSILAFNELTRRAIESAGKENVKLIDVHRAILELPGGLEVCISHNDGHHISVRGHQLYAQMLFQFERAHGLLVQPKREADLAAERMLSAIGNAV